MNLGKSVDIFGKSVPIAMIALAVMAIPVAAATLEYFGTVDGTVEVNQAISADGQFNLEGDEGDFSNTISTAYAGMDDVRTTELGLTNNAPTTVPFDAEVSYDITDSGDAEEVESHLVKSNLNLYEKVPEDGEITVGFDVEDEAVNFLVEGTTEQYNGGLLGVDYETEDIFDISVDYEVERNDDQSEFDWFFIVAEMGEEISEDEWEGDFTLEKGQRYYIGDTQSHDGDHTEADYHFGEAETDNSLAVAEFDENGAYTENVHSQDTSSITLAETFEVDNRDAVNDLFEVQQLRFGSGAAGEEAIEVVYTELNLGEGNILDERIQSVYSEGTEEDGFSEELQLGVHQETNLATVTEVGNYEEDFEVTTELSPVE